VSKGEISDFSRMAEAMKAASKGTSVGDNGGAIGVNRRASSPYRLKKITSQ
jgi:hypothetical protein